MTVVLRDIRSLMNSFYSRNKLSIIIFQVQDIFWKYIYVVIILSIAKFYLLL